MHHRPLFALVAVLTLSTASAWAQSGNLIDYRQSLSLKVGQSAVIYGYRGDCGQLPVRGAIKLPTLATGTLSTGNQGIKDSGRCGRTPAVEIIFTATTAGRESFEVQGDKITVRVKK